MIKDNPTNKKEVSYAESTCGAQVVPAYKTGDWITTDSGPVWLSSMCLDDPPTSRQVISQSQSKNKIVWILEGVQRTTCMEMNHHELDEITYTEEKYNKITISQPGFFFAPGSRFRKHSTSGNHPRSSSLILFVRTHPTWARSNHRKVLDVATRSSQMNSLENLTLHCWKIFSGS